MPLPVIFNRVVGNKFYNTATMTVIARTPKTEGLARFLAITPANTYCIVEINQDTMSDSCIKPLASAADVPAELNGWSLPDDAIARLVARGIVSAG